MSARLPIAILLSSLIPAGVTFFLAEESHRTRNALSLGGAMVKLALIAVMLAEVGQGIEYEARLSLAPGLYLLMRIDALALLFMSRGALLDTAWPLALGLALPSILLAAGPALLPGLRKGVMRDELPSIRLPSGWGDLFIRPAFTAPAVNLAWCKEAAEALERALKRWRFSGLASAVILVALLVLMR